MPRSTSNRNIPAHSRESLERLALRYVERYATTRLKLTLYLERKLYERGWGGEDAAPVAEIVGRMAELGYVDDRQFAEMRAGALTRRGYGKRRVQADLMASGIAADDSEEVLRQSEEEAREVALHFARRKRLGPFAEKERDANSYRRAFAAMARAGHPLDIIKEILTEGG